MADNPSFIRWVLDKAGLPQDPTQYDLRNVEFAVNQIRTFLLGLVAWEVVLGLVLTGYVYFTAYGDESKAEKAKKRITWIIVGLVVVILSEILIYEVQRLVIGSPPADIRTPSTPLLN